MIRRVAVLVVLTSLVAGACGDVERERAEERGAPTTSDDAELAPWCDDLEPLGPVREGNLAGGGEPDEVVSGTIMAYGNSHPDTFAGGWIDRDHGGTVVVGFTDAPEAHRDAIAALPLDPSASSEFSATTGPPPSEAGESAALSPSSVDLGTVADSGVVFDVVQTLFTRDDIAALQDEAMDALEGRGLTVWGVGQDLSNNRVSIDLDVPDDAARRIVAEEFPVHAVCVSGSGPYVPTPTIDPDSPPTLLPPESDDPLVMCQFPDPVPLSALNGPLGFEDTDDPLAAALRETLEGTSVMAYAKESSWRLVARNDELALLVADDPPAGYAIYEWTGDRWTWKSSGSGKGCNARTPLPPGVGQADWVVDPAFPVPDTTDSEIHVLVTESACTGGSEAGERLLGPEVRESDEQVIIIFGTIALTGPQTCPGNPPVAVTVALDAPLGDRVLADGGFVPAEPVD